ncbi:MAG: CCA tRNA nucleotidyltransferase [Nitrospinae bacterium]|nr:CCA tRNA nucleotidyltransferase [Nitrospinota bacterium]
MDNKLDACLKTLKDLSETLGLDLFVVGGTVRDLVMGRPAADYDFVCRDAPRLARQFASRIECPLVPLDDTPGRETYRAVVRKDFYFDFSQMQGQNIHADLSRRDFTFNAMAIPLDDFLQGKSSVIDPHRGKEDLRNRAVRVLPGSAFSDDPLRTLRAFRFASACKFDIESRTLAQIAEHAPLLSRVAAERIYYELLLFLDGEDTFALLDSMDRTGLLATLLPEVPALRLVRDDRTGLDAWQHTLKTYRTAESYLQKPETLFPEKPGALSQFLEGKGRPLLKLAALLSRLNDAPIERVPDKTQERKSRTHGEFAMNRFRASNADIAFVERTLGCSREALASGLKFAGPERDESSLYYFAKRWGKELTPGLLLAGADHAVRSGISELRENPLAPAVQNAFEFYANVFVPAQRSPALLTGGDLAKRFKLAPSPVFKTILERVEEARVLGKIKTRQEAETLTQNLIDAERDRK